MRTSNRIAEKRRPLLLMAGLLTALSFTLVAFEWRTPYTGPTIPDCGLPVEYTWEIPPITLAPVEERKEPPPPPKPAFAPPQIVEVDTPDGAEDTVDEPLFPDELEPAPLTGPAPEPEVEDEAYLPPGRLPEVMPSFCGGEAAMFKKIYDNIRYPEIPRANGVGGRVFITFVVMKDGSIGNVQVARPVDPWLDAEALRVVRLLDCFTPGMQGGRPVQVPFSIPILFQLK